MTLLTIQRKILVLGLLITLVSSPIVLIWYFENHNSDEPQLIGMRVPSFIVSTLSGTTFSFDSRGKKHIFVFFTAECSECRNELSNLDLLYGQFKSQIDFFAISLSNSKETKLLLSSEKYSFPVFQGERNALVDSMKIIGTPTIFFADEQQILRRRYVGDRPIGKDRKLLQEFSNESFIHKQ